MAKIPTQVYFGMLDALLAAEELPEEYRDRCQVSWSTDLILWGVRKCNLKAYSSVDNGNAGSTLQ